MLETGDLRRFPTVGQFASYCRCVGSTTLSNGKRKGRGNTKNGNKYLAWAFVEAAHFAMQYYPCVQRFHQRKKAKTNAIVATKAVAHKLARACYYVMRDHVPFDPQKAFASSGTRRVGGGNHIKVLALDPLFLIGISSSLPARPLPARGLRRLGGEPPGGWPWLPRGATRIEHPSGS